MKNENYWTQSLEAEAEISPKVSKRDKLKRKLEDSTSYVIMEKTAILMDKYYLDPIMGLIPGLGDAFMSVFCLPSIWVSLVKIKSIPLTLAIILNVLIDAMIGMIPFWIGNICDFFNRSYLKNLRLVVGYVNGDEEIINEINKKALISAILIVMVCVAIYYLIQLVSFVWSWTADLFSGLF